MDPAAGAQAPARVDHRGSWRGRRRRIGGGGGGSGAATVGDVDPLRRWRRRDKDGQQQRGDDGRRQRIERLRRAWDAGKGKQIRPACRGDRPSQRDLRRHRRRQWLHVRRRRHSVGPSTTPTSQLRPTVAALLSNAGKPPPQIAAVAWIAACYSSSEWFFFFWTLCTDGMRTGSPRMSSSSWYMAQLVVCYIATFFFSGLLFYWFSESGHDCGLNLFFIVLTLILVCGFSIVALHPKINGSLLPASVIGLYRTYVCYHMDSPVSRGITSATGFYNPVGNCRWYKQRRHLLRLLKKSLAMMITARRPLNLTSGHVCIIST